MHGSRRATSGLCGGGAWCCDGVRVNVWLPYGAVVLDGVTTGGSRGKHMGSWVKKYQIFLLLLTTA